MLNANIKIFSKSPLLKGISEEDYPHIFGCLYAKNINFNKGEVIGDKIVKKIGIIIEGVVDFSIIQFNGNTCLIKKLYSGDHILNFSENQNTPFQSMEYKCTENSKIFFLDMPKPCSENSTCKYCKKYLILENLMDMTSKELMFLYKKLYILSQNKIRDKILIYLKLFNEGNNKKVWIPFNRQELANFLGSDRSAVSRELSNMSKEGILEINENIISIKELPS